MKKLTLIAIAATMVSLGAQGQGLVQFGNSAGATSHISVNTTIGGAATGQFGAVAAGTYYFALFYSTSATTVEGSAASLLPTVGNNLNSSWVWNDTNWKFAGNGGATYNVNGNIFSSGGYAENTGAAGRVNTLLAGTAPDAVAGLGAGSSAQFVVVGWSSTIGTTWSAVEGYLTSGTTVGGAYLGESAVGATVISGDNALNGVPTILAGAVTPAFTLGLLNPIPEPSTMVLAGLGGLSLLLFRRRQ